MRFSQQRKGIGCGFNPMACDRFHLGQVVRVLRGSNAGDFAIVVRLEEPSYLWLADRRKFSVDRPKRKNRKHVQPTNYVVEEISQILRENGRLTDAKIRYALNQYLSQWKGE